jgi:alpha-amylase/alpha-mannosidase (GH57 family)
MIPYFFFGFFDSGDAPAPVVPQVRGGGIDHQRRRKKATIADKPIQQLNQIIEQAFKTVFSELTSKKAPKALQKQANKIVKEYTDEYRPNVAQIDWFAFNQDLEAVQNLFNLYQREIADARQVAENKRIFNLIENDNLEFLLMH